jgi:hypothetical protein
VGFLFINCYGGLEKPSETRGEVQGREEVRKEVEEREKERA